MKRKSLLLLSTAVLSCGILFGQLNQASVAHTPPGGRTCGVMENETRLQQQNPTRAGERLSYEQAVQNWISTNQNGPTTQAIITIPVVVHLVYNTAAENIPDNQILSQIQVLNEDYSLTNADASNIPSAFSGVAGNFGVQFCMAQQDPNGAATTGIERRALATDVSFIDDDNVKHFSSNGLNAWDPSRYFNIWVCNLGGGLLGYAEFPTATLSQTYGVVILYNAFGSNFTSYGTFSAINTVYNRGRTATHEIGHCLNLRHIWGDDNGACSGSDLCADTPNQSSENYGCPTFPHTDACTTTSPGVMFMNYMDYTDDPCMYMFTNNQKSRALAVLNAAPYNSLQTSTACQAPSGAPPVAAFTLSTSSVCRNSPVSFTDNSTNTPTSWSWTFTGGTPGTSTVQNPTGITWATTGTKTVTLVATNANGSNTITHTLTVLALPTITTTTSGATICSGSSTSITGAGGTTYSWMPGNLSGTTVTVSPTTTTTYTVTGANANGCTNTATRTITVNPSPTVTTTTTNASICTGGSTSITAAGATTYAWMPGNLSGTTITVSPTTTTTYTVTGTSGGCTGTATRTITVNPTPTVTTTTTGATICNGSSTTITGAGATTYSWMPGNLSGTTVTVSPTSTTTYTVTGSNGGCTGTATRTITVNPSPTVTTTTTNATICSGSSTTITGTGASTYAWVPGNLTGTTITVSPATTTTYTVTGTSAGCTGTATRTITVNPTPTVTTTTSGATICNGSSTTITGAGATSYSWMPGNLSGTTVTVSPTTTTTYTVTGTSSGCTGTATRTITVNPTPTVTTTTTGATICSGSSTTITGAGATTYAWMPGNLTGTTVTISPATTMTYTVTGTSAGCTGTATRTITVNPTPTVTTTTSTTTICGGGSATLTASGATTYSWMPGNLSGTSITVTPTTTTTYTVTGTSSGCTGTATRTITVSPTPTVTTTTTGATICNGSSTTITGAGATTYSWMPGNLSGTTVTVSPTTTTTYTVTGTNAAGCTATATRTITVNASPTVTTTTSGGTICSGSSTTITGSGATSYSWMPGNLSGTTITVSPATTTTYTVTGTSAGCTGTATRSITVNPTPTVTTTTTAATICAGNSTSITATGASTYTWMPGSLTGSTVTVSPTTTTSYTVTGSNSGCTGTTTQTITVNPAPVLNVNPTAASICAGGTVNLDASPVGNNTFSWSPVTGLSAPNAANTNASPATSTTYTVTKTTVLGCSISQSIVVTVNPTPTLTLTASANSICAGDSTTISASGANAYTWMPGNLSGTSVTVSPSATNTYTVSGTSASGCTASATLSITVNPIPVLTLSAPNATICSGASSSITAGGAASYTWMPGNLSGTTVLVSPTATTTYTVSGITAGCTGTATQLITVNPAPIVTATSSAAVICAGDSVALSASGAVSYNWSPTSTSGANITDAPAVSTSYFVTGIDANGCSGMATVAVTVNPLPVVTATTPWTSICAGNAVTLTGNGAASYNWMPQNVSGPTLTDSPLSTTTYTVNGTDANGCSNSGTITVTVNPLPDISVSGDTLICAGANANLNASGANSYLWTPGNLSGSSVTVSPATATTYSVNGTDANGCSASASITVNVDTPPATPAITVNGATLSSTISGASYQWFLNGNPIAGATSQSYTATQNGVYTVEVYTAAGCGSGQSSGVTDPTGIVSSSVVEFINLFPNPNDGHFQLNFSVTKTDQYVLEIHNVLGQIVYSENLDNFSGAYSKNVDLSAYGKGVYTVRLKNATKETVIKTVIY